MKTSFRQLSREEDACKQLSKCENQNSTISIVLFPLKLLTDPINTRLHPRGMVAPEGSYCAVKYQKQDPQNRSPHPEMTFKPVQLLRSPKSTKNGTLKIVPSTQVFISNRSSFEDPQNQPKMGPSRSFTSPRNDFQTGPVLKIPKKVPKTVIFKILPRGICVTPVHFPLGYFQKSAKQQTDNNEQITDEHQI